MSATPTQELPTADRWESSPIASTVLRVIIAGAPGVAGLLAVVILGRVLPPGHGLGHLVLWWGGSMVLAGGVAFLMRRLVRRLAPLETLLRINIAFPAAVPSRYKMARRINASATLEERVARAKAAGRSGEAGAAAAAILELVFALGDHDKKTRGHSERTRILTDVLAEEMGLSSHDKDRLRWASLLHDVGKLSVRAETLKQARKLTESEWDEIKAHPEAGLALIGPLADWLGEWKDAIPHHHERWDGTGYPAGLAGREISLAGRIVAVADAFEVMTAGRSYQTPRSMRDALVELTDCAGGQFDPTVVRAFLGIPVRRLGLALGPSIIAWQIPVVNTVWPRLGSFLPAQPLVQVQQGVAVAALSGALVTGGVAAMPAGADGADDVADQSAQLHEGPELRYLSERVALLGSAGEQVVLADGAVSPVGGGPAVGGAANPGAPDGASSAGSTAGAAIGTPGSPAATTESSGQGGTPMALSSASNPGVATVTDVEEEQDERDRDERDAERAAEREREEAEEREEERREAEEDAEEERREEAEDAEEDRREAEEDAEEDRREEAEDRREAEEKAEEDRIKAEERAERDRQKAEEDAEKDREREAQDAERERERAARDAEKAEEDARKDREKAEKEAERDREREENDSDDD